MIGPVSDVKNEVMDALFLAVRLALGWTDEYAQRYLRFSHPTKSGGMSFDLSPEEDAVYMRLTQAALSGQNVVSVNYKGKDDGDAIRELGHHTSFGVHFICYGPNATDNAYKLMIGMFVSEISQTLKGVNVAPVKGNSTPVPMSEPYNAMWFERCDFSMNFYHLRTYKGDVQTVQVAPEIIIAKET